MSMTPIVSRDAVRVHFKQAHAQTNDQAATIVATAQHFCLPVEAVEDCLKQQEEQAC